MSNIQTEQANQPQQVLPNIYQGNVGSWVFAFGVGAFLVFLACAALIPFEHKDYPRLSIILGAFWVVLVPAFFLVEHLYIFKKRGNPDQYEQFKQVQDLAAKVWAGAIIVLAAFYAEQFPH